MHPTYLVVWGAAEWIVGIVISLLNRHNGLDSSNETVAVKHENDIQVITVPNVTISRMAAKKIMLLGQVNT